MKISRLTTALLLAGLASVAACSREPAQSTAAADEAARTVGTEVSGAIEKARRKMDKGNISVSGDTAPKAEITPAGDLLIEGRAVTVTPEQRALLLQYRAAVIGVASAGMDVGVQGATLAAKAVGEALRGVVTGRTDEVQERIESQTGAIHSAALKLCDRLEPMMAKQQELAAALPEFKPYATMTGADIDDCRKDAVSEAPAPPTPPAPPEPPAPPVPSA